MLLPLVAAFALLGCSSKNENGPPTPPTAKSSATGTTAPPSASSAKPPDKVVVSGTLDLTIANEAKGTAKLGPFKAVVEWTGEVSDGDLSLAARTQPLGSNTTSPYQAIVLEFEGEPKAGDKVEIKPRSAKPSVRVEYTEAEKGSGNLANLTGWTSDRCDTAKKPTCGSIKILAITADTVSLTLEDVILTKGEKDEDVVRVNGSFSLQGLQRSK
ncbi:MAG: hypothetical protein U0271_20850 [Polyangiaceae bacterium]